ncbi:MAG TPA: ATP-binding cassette domain-containing protein, partial [Holophagaceae bacterium]|nr:ATP-binding cassette domain-containing protein [Holophagaceae bacterium]
NSRRKEVERLAPGELARSNIQRPFIKFEQRKPGGRYALEFEGVKKGYDGLEVVKGFTAMVQRGERIALMGRNGVGKSTLINALLANAPQVTEANLSLDAGTVKWGHDASVGYFAQDFRESIPAGWTMVDWLRQFDPDATIEQIRGVLGQMLFRGEEGTKKTEVLSGGEACRLMFCKLMLQKPNILVLDEPTNHLDLEAVIALNTALQNYAGTLLLVTHDEDLIEEVATRIWNFKDGAIEDFQGTYEEYQAKAGA